MGSLTMQYNPTLHVIAGPTGITSHLSPQCHKLINLLLEKEGELVTREELREKVWGHEYVSDDAINHAVARLRTKIKDVEGEGYWHIESFPGVGYQLCIHNAAQPSTLALFTDKLKRWWSRQ